MKFLAQLSIILALLSCFTACNNSTAEGEINDAETVVVNPYTMTAVIDSLPWTATSVDTREDQGTIYITGIAADGSQLILELGEKPRIGIFPMRRGAMQAGTYISKEGSKFYAPFAGTSGVINVTEYAKDSIIKAEFNFSATNSLELHVVEGGVFVAPMHQNAAKPAL